MSPTLLAVTLLAGLAGVWSGWLLAARVPVYQRSDSARLEVERVHPVAATVAGRVVSTTLVLGRNVRQGDVLVEIEADRQWLESKGERTRAAAVTREIEALQHEILSQQQATEESRLAAKAALVETSQRAVAAEAAARQAQNKLGRLVQLQRQGLTSVADVETARSEGQARQAELAAARASVDRLRAEQVAAQRDKRGQLAALIRQRANLEGLMAAQSSTVARAEREVELRRIKAPVSGHLGEVNPVQIGAVILEGQQLASIIPAGRVRAVAEFTAPALGKLHPGQPARLRLDGFPWTQYGHVMATVTRVASETREQRVRVELSVDRQSKASIPLQHGMPGAVEVEVERVAPFALLLRSLGQSLSDPPPASTESEKKSEPRNP